MYIPMFRINREPEDLSVPIIEPISSDTVLRAVAIYGGKSGFNIVYFRDGSQFQSIRPLAAIPVFEWRDFAAELGIPPREAGEVRRKDYDYRGFPLPSTV